MLWYLELLSKFYLVNIESRNFFSESPFSLCKFKMNSKSIWNLVQVL